MMQWRLGEFPVHVSRQYRAGTGTNRQIMTFRKEEYTMIRAASIRNRQQAHDSGAFLNLKSQFLM
jgi:hypothetical protein